MTTMIPYSFSACFYTMTAILQRLFGMLFLAATLCPHLVKAQQDSAFFIDWTGADSNRCSGDLGHFRWEGNTLQLDAPMDGMSFIERSCVLSGDWQVSFQLTLGFNPSSVNYSLFQCQATSSSYLELRIGANQDELALFRVDGRGENLLCVSPAGVLDYSQTEIFIEISYDRFKRYHLRWYASPGSASWGEVISPPDSLVPPIHRLRWVAQYSASRRDKFTWSSIWVVSKPNHALQPWIDWRWTEVFSNPQPLIPGISPPVDFLEGEILGVGPKLMADWTLRVNQRSYPLASLWLPAGQAVVIGPEVLRSQLPPEAILWPLEIDLPGDASIELEHSSGQILGQWTYSQTWHHPKGKAQGGYSLEPSHREQACLPATWHSCTELSGASLGRFPAGDRQPIALNYPSLRALPDSSGRWNLHVEWRHPIDPSTLPSNAEGRWDHVRPGLSIWSPLVPPIPGQLYALCLPRVWSTCAGDRWEIDSLFWGLPRMAQAGELLWTELLADPLPFEPRFIELYNATKEVLDLGALFVGDAPWPMEWRRLGRMGEFILPKEVWAYSEDPRKSAARYSAGDSTKIRPLAENLWAIEEGGYVGLFRSDGLELEQMEGMRHSSALGAQSEGLSWGRSTEGGWFTSGDSASPGRWQPEVSAKSVWGRVQVLQDEWSSIQRPQVAFQFREEGAWQLRERWLHIRGDAWTAWKASGILPAEGTWTSLLEPPPGKDWLWELEWTSPSSGIRRRAFMLKMRE